MVTKQDLENKREQIQDDILCILDGMDNKILIDVCQVVVDHFNQLIEKVEA